MRMMPMAPSVRAVHSVSADVERLLGSKSLEQLNGLEEQVNGKLRSTEPIDVEYWEQLLGSIAVYKAKAELRNIYKSVIDSRRRNLRMQQIAEARHVQEKLAAISEKMTSASQAGPVAYSRNLDPEPLLKVKVEDKGLSVVEESKFISNIVSTTRAYSQHLILHTDAHQGGRTPESAQDGLCTNATTKA